MLNLDDRIIELTIFSLLIFLVSFVLNFVPARSLWKAARKEQNKNEEKVARVVGIASLILFGVTFFLRFGIFLDEVYGSSGSDAVSELFSLIGLFILHLFFVFVLAFVIVVWLLIVRKKEKKAKTKGLDKKV